MSARRALPLLSAIGGFLLVWAAIRATLVVVLLVHAPPLGPAAWAALGGLAVWTAFDVMAGRALVRRALLGRMMGFVTAALQSVGSYGVAWLADDPRWYGGVIGFAAIATLLAIIPDER